MAGNRHQAEPDIPTCSFATVGVAGVSANLGLMQSVKQSNPGPGKVTSVYWQIR